jgi:hypothetical protein
LLQPRAGFFDDHLVFLRLVAAGGRSLQGLLIRRRSDQSGARRRGSRSSAQTCSQHTRALASSPGVGTQQPVFFASAPRHDAPCRCVRAWTTAPLIAPITVGQLPEPIVNPQTLAARLDESRASRRWRDALG